MRNQYRLPTLPMKARTSYLCLITPGSLSVRDVEEIKCPTSFGLDCQIQAHSR